MEAALPPGGDPGDAAQGDKEEGHDPAVPPQLLGAGVGDVVQQHIGGLVAVVHIPRHIVVDGPRLLHRSLTALGDTLTQLPEIGGKGDVGQLLLGVESGLDLVAFQGVGVHIGRMVLIAIGDLKTVPLAALPVDGSGGGVRRGQDIAGGGVQDLDLALLGAVRRDGEPGLDLFPLGPLGGPDRGLQGDAGGQPPLPLHPGEHFIPPGVVHRLGFQAGGLLFRIDTHAAQKAVVVLYLSIDIPPINAAVVYQSVKLLLGKLGPLGPDLGDGLLPGKGEVILQPGKPHPLSPEPGGQLGLGAGGEIAVNEPQGACNVPRLYPPLHIGGEGVHEMAEILVLKKAHSSSSAVMAIHSSSS